MVEVKGPTVNLTFSIYFWVDLDFVFYLKNLGERSTLTYCLFIELQWKFKILSLTGNTGQGHQWYQVTLPKLQWIWSSFNVITIWLTIIYTWNEKTRNKGQQKEVKVTNSLSYIIAPRNLIFFLCNSNLIYMIIYNFYDMTRNRGQQIQVKVTYSFSLYQVTLLQLQGILPFFYT